MAVIQPKYLPLITVVPPMVLDEYGFGTQIKMANGVAFTSAVIDRSTTPVFAEVITFVLPRPDTVDGSLLNPETNYIEYWAVVLGENVDHPVTQTECLALDAWESGKIGDKFNVKLAKFPLTQAAQHETLGLARINLADCFGGVIPQKWQLAAKVTTDSGDSFVTTTPHGEYAIAVIAGIQAESI